jgi:hypothetical protein
VTSLSDLLTAFRGGFSGLVVTANEDGYDAMREIAMGGIDKRPSVILRPRSAADVSAAVALARDNGLELAVRSGGHSGAGHSTTEGGVVIDLRDMQKLDIDETAKTAWADTGLTAGEVSAAVTRKGLAIGFGDAATVGVGGITTGGGVGYLSRKYGLTIDSVLAAEVVTADGAVLMADEAHHPDLFWAVRGGGGNFGVVTRLKFRLSPLSAFTGGMLVLPATAETIDGFLAAARAAPRELGTIANIMPAPPLPFLPAEWHGRLIIMGMMAFAGADAAAVAALKPFRELVTPLADFVKPGPYMQMFPPEESRYKPVVAYRNLYFAPEPGAGRSVVGHLEAGEGMRVIQVRVLGGAINDIATDATAYAHRGEAAMAQVVAFVDEPSLRPARQKWVDDFAAALKPTGNGAAYVNFLAAEGEARVRAAYPGATWDRLRAIKKRLDPQNLFHGNQNIPPAA